MSTASRPATLANHAENGFRLTPTCRGCWHLGATVAPESLAERHGLPMAVEHPAIERRLVCSRCGAREGYLALQNPAVRPHGT